MRFSHGVAGIFWRGHHMCRLPEEFQTLAPKCGSIPANLTPSGTHVESRLPGGEAAVLPVGQAAP